MQLSVREVARLLNVPDRTIYRWISQGTLPAYRVNEQYRFNRAELLEWATSRKISVSTELFQNLTDAADEQPGLADALEAGGVIYGLKGDEKESVLRAMVDGLTLPNGVDREFLFRVLLAREALGSTGIGEGIAIPHARNPIVLHVDRPTITLCFLEKPIDFKAIDGQPVHTLFSLISPTVGDHLHLLSRLAFALRDPKFKDAIKRRKARDEIIKAARRLEANLGRSVDGTAKEPD